MPLNINLHWKHFFRDEFGESALGEEVTDTADVVTGENTEEVAGEAAREATDVVGEGEDDPGDIGKFDKQLGVEASVADDTEDTEHVGGEGEDDPGDKIGKFDKLLTVETN